MARKRLCAHRGALRHSGPGRGERCGTLRAACRGGSGAGGEGSICRRGTHRAAPKALPVQHLSFLETQDKRLIFTVPYLDTVFVGTTDTSYDGADPSGLRFFGKKPPTYWNLTALLHRRSPEPGGRGGGLGWGPPPHFGA